MKTKRYILLFFMALCVCATSFAQSMSDDAIIEFVQKEQKAGSSQAQIVTKLMQKGVTVDKIRQLRKKYGNSLSEKTTQGRDGQPSETRLRENNAKAAKPEVAGFVSEQEILEKKRGLNQQNSETDYNQEGETDNETNPLSQSQDKKKKSNIFGHDIFNNELLSFEPNMNIATPQNYRLGPGDAVYVDIYGASQKTFQTTITPDGEVVIEGFGPIQVSGLTVSEANARLKSTLGSRYSSSKVRLTVGQTRTIMVNVMGEVSAPGTYTISAFSTVFHALYMAGGVNEIGTLRNIKVYRQNKLITTVDVYDYILNGQLTGNVKLADNDVIVVSSYENLVSIGGKIKRPMQYEMKSNETVSTLFKYAGGFTGDAYRKSVKLFRNNGEMKSVHNIGEFDMPSFTLIDKDSIAVDSILDRYENTVEISGAVFRPGHYNLGGSITTVRGLVEEAQGLTEEAFTNRALLYRKKANRTTEMLSLDIEGIMNGTATDVSLKSEDVLFVPTISEKINVPNLVIYGAVNDPGQYLYSENETVEDLILQAGGLLSSASMSKIDVARRIVNPYATEETDTLALTFSFAIKDGFVVDGGNNFYLQPYDQVYVRTSPGYSEQRNVTVSGSVQFPGEYTLPRKNVRLSEILKMAGGFTNSAYIEGTRLEREMDKNELARMNTVKKLQKMQSSDKDTLSLEKLNLETHYTVEINAKKAIEQPDSQWDVVLKEGDIISVPEMISTVKISGDVMFPNTVSFRKGKSFRYYIDQAGGWGQTAKKRNTYVIHMNGKVEKAIDAKIEPGCEIVVPSKAKKEKITVGERVAIVSGIASLATVIATLVNVLK